MTKEGALAGPRVLEHLVDCVLQFEGERERTYRTLRALKNRFGSTNDAGVFEMAPRAAWSRSSMPRPASSRRPRARPAAWCSPRWRGRGRCSWRSRRWSRPPSSSRRGGLSTGIDRNRLALVLAVLARHAGVAVGTADVFVNVVGGVRVDEPGADLAVALAVASAAAGVPLGAPGVEACAACFGEVGLTGELRPVAHAERRLAEAARFGLEPVLAPPGSPAPATPVRSLREAVRAALPGPRAAVAAA